MGILHTYIYIAYVCVYIYDDADELIYTKSFSKHLVATELQSLRAKLELRIKKLRAQAVSERSGLAPQPISRRSPPCTARGVTTEGLGFRGLGFRGLGFIV